MGNEISKIVGESIFLVGLHQTDKLLAFLNEPDRYSHARRAVAETVADVALQFPERRPEILHWYENIFAFFIQNKSDNRIIDTDLIGFMVWDSLNLETKELRPSLEKIYAEQLAGIKYIKSWKKCALPLRQWKKFKRCCGKD